jgi:tRNA pseudouridine38-40 synthase
MVSSTIPITPINTATITPTNTPLAVGQRIALIVEYNGASYNGWQLQSGDRVRTVQGELERSLALIANTPVRVHCAGRTDSGVHATHQVVHFDAPAERSARSWLSGTNTSLPDDIVITSVQAVNDDFHARFSALFRRYRYLVYNHPTASALSPGNVTWVLQVLDVQLMHEAAQALLGEQDFSAFRAASCQSRTPMRHVDLVSVTRRGPLVVIDIQANAFLHHMVRNIVGSLLAVGRCREDPGWIGELLVGRDRTLAAATAPATGLYLVDVGYPEPHGIADTKVGPWFLH